MRPAEGGVRLASFGEDCRIPAVKRKTKSGIVSSSYKYPL
jgi:hypothetical protein